MATRHAVRQGECLASIAAAHGFAEWEPIYEHPENAQLRERGRKAHLLYPGDTVFIPDKEPKSYAGATGRRHRFVLKRPPVTLRLRLLAPTGEAIANRKYLLLIDDQRYEGETDGEGDLEHPLAPATENAVLHLWHDNADPAPAIFFPLAVGHLDPVEETSGVQARLRNLGFHCEETGALDELTQTALRRFQRKHQLPETGAIDDVTTNKLTELHELD